MRMLRSVIVFYLFSIPALAAIKPISCKELLPTLGVKIHSFTGNSVESDLSPSYQVILNGIRGQAERDPAWLGRMLTDVHGGNDNSFRVKDPKTGQYGPTTSVSVSPFVAPLPKTQFDKVIKSTEPLLRTYRVLLQRIFGGELSIEALGLDVLPKEDAELALKVITESIYLEPMLRRPSMRTYPFVPVAGLDGAIGDPANMKPRFFEVNLGTPSGLSNNAQLEQELAKLAPDFYGSIQRFLGPDQTFQLLKQTIESNALAWTGISGGLAVIIGPGEYNAAHPDVVALSRYSGMPLVRAQDLYMGKDGYIYWNVGPNKSHPMVTGIYGRREESFFLQSDRLGIPLISPDFTNNEELGKKLGVRLRPGAIYKFKYTENGQIYDVERDGWDRPVLESVWETIGNDPSGAPSRSDFAEAIVNKKLYFSAIGGRVVDDKRLFPIVAKLAGVSEDGAQPVKSLPRSEYSKLYANPNQFFVKEPSNSGGKGVYAMALESEVEKAAVIAKVKAHPENYEVQYISEITTLPVIVGDKIDEVPTDLRFFVMLDADGNARAGRNSILLRTAKSGDLLTNTSRGGGYGIGLVFDDKANPRELDWQQSLPIAEKYKVQPTSFVTESRLTDLGFALKQANQWAADVADARINDEELRQRADQLVGTIRGVMDLLPKSMHGIIAIARHYSENGFAAHAQTVAAITKWHEALESESVFPVPDAKATIQQYMNAESWRLSLKGMRGELAGKSQKYFEFIPFENPEVVYNYYDQGNEKVEIGRYEIKGHPFLLRVQKELADFGGELRLARSRVAGSPDAIFDEGAYFWVNFERKDSSSYLKPIIAIDLTEPMALASLAHEFEHFLFWRNMYQQGRTNGLGHPEAIEWAARQIDLNEFWLLSERAAVKAEMAIEQTIDKDIFARAELSHRRAQTPVDIGYVNRITYPEFSVLRRLLMSRVAKGRWDGNDEKRAIELVQFLTEAAVVGREQAINTLKEYATKSRWSKAELAEINRSRDLRKIANFSFPPQLNQSDMDSSAKGWENLTIYDVLVKPYGESELTKEGTLNLFKEMLAAELFSRRENDYGVPRELVVTPAAAAATGTDGK